MIDEMNLEDYFNSDAFLEQPFMQALKREMEREKILVSNPVQIAKMEKAYRLIQHMVEEEMIAAEIKIETEELTHTDAAIVVYADSWEGSKTGKTLQEFQEVLELCDCYLILPTIDKGIRLDCTFKNIMIEI